MHSVITSQAVVLLLVLLGFGTGRTQDTSIPTVANTYALTGATVIKAPGDTTFNATVILQDGLIKSVSQDSVFPVFAEEIPCDSLFVYAGFIEGISNTGIPREDESSQQGNNDQGNEGPPTDADRGIQPARQASKLFISEESSVSGRRKIGFTASLVVPEGGMLPGRGSLISLGTGSTDHLVLRDAVCMYLRLAPARRIYPGTTIGVIAQFRELMHQARFMNQHVTLFSETGNGLPRPRYDASVEAMIPVAEGGLPIYFYTSNALDMYKALGLQKELNFNMQLVEVREGWYLQAELSANPVPVLLSLQLPDDIEGPSDDDTSVDTVEVRTKTEEDIEKEQLIARRNESREQHFRNAGVIASLGVPFGFSTLEVRDKDIMPNLRKMVEYGLSEEDALAGLTINPATLMGMEKLLGTVEPGKLASIVVTSRPLLDEDMQVLYVFVEGEKFEYETRKKKTGKSSNGEGEGMTLAGNWSILVEIPGDPQSGTMRITGDDGNFQGKIFPDDGDISINMTNINKDGNVVTFDIVIVDGENNIPAAFELTLDGDTLSGSMTSSVLGSFIVSGERIP